MSIPARPVVGRRIERLTVGQIKDTGLLHVVNEAVLWPKGMTLTVRVRATCMTEGEIGHCDHTPDHLIRDAEPAEMFFEVLEDRIVTDLDADQHAALHREWDAIENLP